MVYITHIHMVGGEGHEHIGAVRWRDPADSGTGESTREAMVDWLENKGGKAYVEDGSNQVAVGVVQATPPYIRTYANKEWTDNLLALPRF